MMKAAVAFTLLVAIVAAVEYVDIGSTCTMNCGTMAEPHPDVRGAIEKLGTGGDIMIASGTYTGFRNLNFTLVSGTWTFTGDATNKPIFSCDRQQGGAHVESGTSGTFKFENLLFRRCLEGNGGVIRAEGGTVELVNVDFESNEADFSGGALYLLNADGVIRGGSFKDGTAGFGGAIYIEGGKLDIHGPVTFERNGATNGGDIYAEDAEVNFVDPTADALPGGLMCPRAVITFKTSDASTDVSNICGSGRGQASTNQCVFTDAAECQRRAIICVGTSSGSAEYRCGCYGALGDCIGDSQCGGGAISALYKSNCTTCQETQCAVPGVDTTPVPYDKFFVFRVISCGLMETETLLANLTSQFTTALSKPVTARIRRIIQCDEYNQFKRGVKRQSPDSPTIEVFAEVTQAEEQTLITTVQEAFDQFAYGDFVQGVEIGPLGPTPPPMFPTGPPTNAPVVSYGSVVTVSMLLMAVLAILF